MSSISKIPSFIGENKTLKDEIIIRTIKILDIGYVVVILCILGTIMGFHLDQYYGTFDPNEQDKKPIYNIYIDVIIHLYILGILTYIIRNIVEQIPYPLHNVHGYDHFRLKELKSSGLFVYILAYYQTNLHAKMNYIIERWKKKDKKNK